MATPSSILAWRTPWMEEPAGLQTTGAQRVRQDLATKQQQMGDLRVLFLSLCLKHTDVKLQIFPLVPGMTFHN